MIAESPILSVRGLRVAYQMGRHPVEVLHGVDLDIAPGETVGVVGESGSGKSTLAFAIMRHLAQNGRVSAGQILFRGEDLLARTDAELRSLRGRQLAMVYQDPQTSLNPSLRIGEQIAEILRTHEHLGSAEAWQRALEMLERVRLPRVAELARRFPHQLSGGQRQRVTIAMALVCNPTLLIMDEPTTALDVTTEARILDLVADLKHEFASSILYISHNIGVIARVADRVAVMYAGQIVEEGEVHKIFAASRHPYTVGLRASLPRLDMGKYDGVLREIPGRIPAPTELPPGCLFQPRCSYARPECGEGRPPLLPVEPEHVVRCLFWKEVDPLPRAAAPEVVPKVSAGQVQLLTVDDLTKYYETSSGLPFLGGARHAVHAVDGVSLTLGQGETLAIVGESGSGKTTLARTIVGLQEPSGGRLAFERREMAGRVEKRPSALLRALQMVFQNPDSSLNPRHTILEIVGRPLQRFKRVRGAQLRSEVAALLQAVNLSEAHLDRFPEQLSGGEKQRVAILRAFAGEPRAVLCDEPVSALDVSVQAAVLNLLLDLQRRHGAAYILISHDLAVVRYLADRIAVMYAGRIVEHGTVEQVFAPPYHPYTEALLSAIPIPDPSAAPPTIRLEGTPAFDVSFPGCPFAARCPRKIGSTCETTAPPIVEAAPGHTILCHIPLDELRKLAPVAPGYQDDVAVAAHAPA